MRHQVSALLLAAGSGRRMGRTKQLLPLGDKPVIAHSAEAIAAAGITEIVVVTGRDHDAVRASLSHLAVRFASNDDPESDMAESIRAGLKEVGTSSSGILVCLAHHPLVSPRTIEEIIREHEKRPDKIIIPVYKGRKGHPSLFPSELIQGISSAGSLRDILTGHPDRIFLLEATDEGVVLDMDTDEDYRGMTEKFRALKNR